MLASKWSGVRKPKGLRRLILSNSPADLDIWEKAYAEYRELLPEDVKEKLRNGKEAEDWKGAEYEEALVFFFKKYMCTADPMPPELQESFAWAARDGTVSLTM